MKKKLTFLIFILAVSLSGFYGCGAKTDASATDSSLPSSDDITYEILWSFYSMCKTPHTTGNEEKLAASLQFEIEKLGFTCIRDDKNNVIAEVPATKGYENAPLTILQGHIDMAEAKADVNAQSTASDPINVVITSTIVQSDKKTALGADCGVGNAAILYLISRPEFEHGPLRVIFTSGGEGDMNGAKGIDPMYIKNAEYLINVAGYDENSIVAGCAAGRWEAYTKDIIMAANTKERAILIKAEGFAGGHFGSEMDKNRANALKIISEILSRAQKVVDFEIADWKAGDAVDSIPGECEVVVAINMYDSPAFEKVIYEVMYEVQEEYQKTDPGGTITYEATGRPSAVLEQQTKNEVIALINGLYDGIYSLTDQNDIMTCANVESILIEANQIRIVTAIKSSIPEELRIIANQNASRSAATGFNMQVRELAGWPMDHRNILISIMSDAYNHKTGNDANVIVSNATLETVWFLEKNPALYAVTVGPTIVGSHTVNEYIKIDTIAPFVNTLANALKTIGSQPQEE